MKQENEVRSLQVEPTTFASSCQVPIPVVPPEDATVYNSEDYARREKDVERDLDEAMSQVSGLIQGPPLTQAKKYCLLALFCLGVFMDGKLSCDGRVFG